MLRPQLVVLGRSTLQLAGDDPVRVNPQRSALPTQFVVYDVAVCVVEAEVVPDSATEFFVAASR